jgi:CBS-domain-containing membrane protein
MAEAGHLLLDGRTTALPVVDADRLVGMISRSDLLRHRVFRDPRAHPQADLDRTEPPHTVADMMTPDPITLPPGADEAEAASIMLQHGIRSLPVVRDGRLAGVVSATDILRAQLRGDSRVAGATDRRGLRVLDLDTCLSRLRSAPMGRVSFVRDGAPVILPVNHAMDGTTVVFRTTWGSKLLVAEGAEQVAFEVDGIDPGPRRGWSVLIRGAATRVYDDAAVDRYERLPLRWWTPPPPEPVWIAIRPDEITGRET